MIIVRSPLRISLAGGATDIPVFYEKYGGFCISAAINKYVYTSISEPFEERIILKYSEIEKTDSIEKIKNNRIRESLLLLYPDIRKIEVSTFADVPSSSGLGGSSSFVCSLVKAISSYKKEAVQNSNIAEIACNIEINRLGENIGKQDQYISAYGGIKCLSFFADDFVKVDAIHMKQDAVAELEDRILLFYTGITHNANAILKDQIKQEDNLIETKKQAFLAKSLLENGEVLTYGKLVHEHWMNKKKRSLSVSTEKIDELYTTALTSGAVGGKLVGAGGGGFLLFVASDPYKLRNSMGSLGLQELRFSFDFEGTKQVI